MLCRIIPLFLASLSRASESGLQTIPGRALPVTSRFRKLQQGPPTQYQAARQYIDGDHYIYPGGNGNSGSPVVNYRGPQVATPRPRINSNLSAAVNATNANKTARKSDGSSGSSASMAGSSDSSASFGDSSASYGSCFWIWPWEWKNWPWERPYWQRWQYLVVLFLACCLCALIVPCVAHVYMKLHPKYQAGQEAPRRRKRGRRDSDDDSDSSDEAFGDTRIIDDVRNASLYREWLENQAPSPSRSVAFSARTYLQPQQEHLKYVEGDFATVARAQPWRRNDYGY